ncbi:MAG: dienelactone hydrolase family protein [Pseudorhodoplanes sp.]
MDQRIIDLYDRFTHGRMNRRDFLDRLTEVAGSAAAAAALLPLLKNDPARAAIVAPDDPRLAIDTASYEVQGVKISGQLVRLKAKGKRPAVLVIHENRGLNAHIQDVARRVALEGFLVFAIDVLSPWGGTPSDDEKGREMFAANVKPEEAAPRVAAAIPFLAKHAESTGKVGAVGFCWGGGMVNSIAMLSPDLNAGVAYNGQVPPLDNVAQIKAPLLLHYAGLDTNVNGRIPEYEAALKNAGKKYTLYMYPDVNHAFNNDTGAARYNKAAADLAWGRTIAFFKDNVGAPPKSS